MKFKLKTNQTLNREIIFPIITKNEMFFGNLEIILETKLKNYHAQRAGLQLVFNKKHIRLQLFRTTNK